MAKKEFFIVVNNKHQGPYTLDELGAHDVQPNSRIFRKGSKDIVNAEDIAEIKSKYFSGQRPAPKPVPEPVTQLDPLNQQSLNEAAQRERRMREQMEEVKRQAEISSGINPGALSNEPPSFGGAPATPGFQPAPEEKKEWHLQQNNQRTGPMTLSELQSSGLTPQSYVWREGMSNWQLVTTVPEVSPFVSPVGPMQPPAQPMQPVQPPQPVYGGYDGGMGDGYSDDVPTVDEQAYGNPTPVPITGLILSLAYLLFAIYLFFGAYGDAFDLSEGESTGGIVLLLLGTFLPSLGLAICGLVNSTAAGRAFNNGQMNSACKKSGAATAYGWGSIALTILSIIFIISFILTVAELVL